VTPRSRPIQISYVNTFKSIWEYEESFRAGTIDFYTYIGPACPLCGRHHCYRQMRPYWRNAIELFPLKKRRVPIVRFQCRSTRGTFSLLPIQLIPYVQYTVGAVIGTLLMGLGHWQQGQRGFYGASVEVDPDSEVTPWLIWCWLTVVLRGLRRGHPTLRRLYDLSGVRTTEARVAWEEVKSYCVAFAWDRHSPWPSLVMAVVRHYSHTTEQFLFGVPSQQRPSRRG
jgi:hypothetical protein